MIECSNQDCQMGRWFHLTCIDLDTTPEGDWWCCEDCKETRSSIFCNCHIYLPHKATIECLSGHECVGARICHIECIGVGQGGMLHHWQVYIFEKVLHFACVTSSQSVI